MDEEVKFILDSTKESMEASIEHLQKFAKYLIPRDTQENTIAE